MSARAASGLPTPYPRLGLPSAPTHMTVWFDYQCPYCKLFWRDALPRLVTNYVNKGQLMIEFRDFQFLGPDSLAAALFARAVWERYPDRYYDWSRAMFDAQDEENGGFGDFPSIEKLTRSIPGIDVPTVIALVKAHGNRYVNEISADYKYATSLGIDGTPTIAVNGKLVAGAETYDDIVKRIAQSRKR